MFVNFNIKSFGELIRNYIHSFMNRLQGPNNLLLQLNIKAQYHCTLIFGPGGLIS